MGFAVECSSIRVLARDFGSVPAELRAELRPRMRMAGEHLKTAIQSAASWSTRIPGAVRMSTAFGSKTGGVRISVSAARAPHARILEHQGVEGFFRHPVFGDRDIWVSQAAHPFFFRTVKAGREQVVSLVADAVRASFPTGGQA